MSINETDNVLDIQTNNGNYKLTGFNAKEFPELSQIKDAQAVSIESTILNHAIGQASFAIGNDESRKAMTGLYCQFDKDGATFVATDAQKLVRFKRRDVSTEWYFQFHIAQESSNPTEDLPTERKFCSRY
jgi:DNA polymerase-3 subunit beta